MNQGLATPSSVVHKLEKAQVQRQLFLCDATMRAQPGTQQRPKPFERIDMDFMKPIAVFITGILTSGVIDTLVLIAPFRQTIVDIILIRVYPTAGYNNLHDHGLDRHLLHIGQHTDDDVAVTLDQTQHRRFLVRQRPTPPFSSQPSPMPFSALLSHDIWTTFVPGYEVHFVGFDFARQVGRLFLTPTPSRNWVVIVWASSTDRSSSAAICSLDKFRSMKYRHNTQPVAADDDLQIPSRSNRQTAAHTPSTHTAGDELGGCETHACGCHPTGSPDNGLYSASATHGSLQSIWHHQSSIGCLAWLDFTSHPILIRPVANGLPCSHLLET